MVELRFGAHGKYAAYPSVPKSTGISMHPIPGKERRGHAGGTAVLGDGVRVFRQFEWLGADSVKMALSRPAHQRVTQTVSPPQAKQRW
jgi:hypothetical protein